MDEWSLLQARQLRKGKSDARATGRSDEYLTFSSSALCPASKGIQSALLRRKTRERGGKGEPTTTAPQKYCPVRIGQSSRPSGRSLS